MVMSERLDHDEDYGFDYQFVDHTLTKEAPRMETDPLRPGEIARTLINGNRNEARVAIRSYDDPALCVLNVLRAMVRSGVSATAALDDLASLLSV